MKTSSYIIDLTETGGTPIRCTCGMQLRAGDIGYRTPTRWGLCSQTCAAREMRKPAKAPAMAAQVA